ncbi:hypothetical protein LH464_15035 [Neorhizobium sp. T786]|uniref:hypothetical protein n=1 Tax=Pseudorhizobium xiangyangii TaxID=2883104 RepID=UPI001D001805|nr:hypothetical protein [Neorhizobium xiangyangii]MCB5203786.1 hypothetical protein [Neorhizobium xiangyangii]
MNLVRTRVVHEGAGSWIVDFLGDDGESVSIKVADDVGSDEADIVEHAKRIMIQLADLAARQRRSR